MISFKKIFIPSGDQSELVAYESWSVKWTGIIVDTLYPSLSKLVLKSEVFTNQPDAIKFAQSLKDAYKVVDIIGLDKKVEVLRNNK